MNSSAAAPQHRPADWQDWLILLHAPGLGARRIGALLARHTTAAAAVRYGARDSELPAASREALRTPDAAALAQSEQWLAEPGTHLITLDDPIYPALLRQLPDPPVALFLQGRPAALQEPQLAVVGSRNPTPAGREIAERFSYEMAAHGLTISSGLALGIDAAAHRGALRATAGCTVAVFGTGPDRIYPARHRDLAHAIVDQGGVLVSEFPPGTPSRPGHFPMRNRIISGLALGVLVVEAALQSGSLITARSALEQGREVFAVPGSINNPLSRGSHRLIRDGATLVESGDDILRELAPLLQPYLLAPVASSEVTDGIALPPLAAEQQRLLQCLDDAPISIEAIAQLSGLTLPAVSSMLLSLELDGYLTKTPAGYARTGNRA